MDTEIEVFDGERLPAGKWKFVGGVLHMDGRAAARFVKVDAEETTPPHVGALAVALAGQDGHDDGDVPHWYRGEAYEVIRRLAEAGWTLARAEGG